MTAVPFDTLKLADRLQAGGFTAEQSRTASAAFAEAMSGADLVTKADIKDMATKADVAEIKAELKQLEQRMTLKLGAMLGAGVAFLSLFKVFSH